MIKASWLSWLERRPVTAEVGGSSPPGVVFIWDLSSAGRASALQAEGHRFEPYRFQCCRRGGTGRRAGLKILLWKHSTGSIPVAGSKVRREIQEFVFLLFLLYRRSYRELLYNKIHFLERKKQNEYFFLK